MAQAFEPRGGAGIDIFEGDAIDEAAFKALVREAVALNVQKKPKGA